MPKNKKSGKHKNSSSHKPRGKLNEHMANADNIPAFDVTDIEPLRKETDFAQYLELLKPFAEKYAVLIVAIDTPVGPRFTQQMALKLHELGLMPFNTSFYRKSYAAVIHKGEKLFEKVGLDDMELVNYEGVIDGVNIMIKSAGFCQLSKALNPTLGIFIENEKQTPQERGIHIVLLDTRRNAILDICNFDSFGRTKCAHYEDISLDSLRRNFLKWVNSHPEITVLSCNVPVFPTQNLSENERRILDEDISGIRILANIHNPQYSILHKYVETPDEIIDLTYQHEAELDLYGVPQFKDKRSRLFNCRGGLRLTTDQPEKYKRALYYIGPSYAVGCGCSDRGTIASNLQRLLNSFTPESEIIVYNYSCYYRKTVGSNDYLLLKKIQSMPVRQGDIVLIHERAVSDCKEIPFINISDLFQRPHNYGEVYYDKGHFTEDGSRVIAERIFECLKGKNFYADKVSSRPHTADALMPDNGLELSPEIEEKLQDYRKFLTDYYNKMFPRPKLGAIVMNCNPFTLGHRYLIERAAAQADYLIIFVVQEDKSFFSFEDRLKLVEEGVNDLKNVAVMPSGQFIISSLTFTEYFEKSELQDRVIDSSMDLNLFGQKIAPCLDIKARFVGEEPFDMVTKQYNETMKSILPQYGIEVVEIPRKEQGGEAISASRVRALLEEKKFDEIARLVPKSTLDYLKSRYA